MTSAQGGGEGGNQKEDENGQGGRGGLVNLDVIFLDDTLEIGYSDTLYLSRSCHYNRLFLYQIILIGALFNQVHNQN